MKRPFAHIGFSMAITLIILNLLPYNYILPITIGLAIIFIASLALSKFRQAVTVPLCIGTALFACLLFLLVYNSTVIPQIALDNQTSNTTFYIVDMPEITENGYRYTIKVTNLILNNAPQNIKLKLKTDFLIDAKPYQLLNARLSFYSVGEKAFSSYGYWGDNIFLTAKTDVVTSTNQFKMGPSAWIYAIRKSEIDLISSYLQGEEGAVSIALITGYRSPITSRLKNAFVFAGASHIMSVSGFHLVMVVGTFTFILRKLKLNKRLVSLLSIAMLAVFIGFTGYSKSTVRAGIMMFVLLFGDLINRRADALNSLGIAVFAICLNPFAVTDTGVQLSVVSTLALIVMLPLFYRNTNKVVEKLLMAVIIPACALLFTAPIMYLSYGYLSIAGLLSNMFISAFGSISIALSFVSLFAFKFGFFPTVFSFGLTMVNKALIKIVYYFASLNSLTVDLSTIYGIVFAGVLIIFAFVYFTGNLKLLKVAGTFSTLIICGVAIVSMIFSYNNAFVMVSKTGSLALKFRDEAVIYCKDDKCDIDDFSMFINPNHNKVDVIVAQAVNDDLKRYIAEYGCENLVIDTENGDLSLINYCDNYEESNEFLFNENNVEIKTYKNDEMSYCLLGVNNVTIVDGKNILSNCDINISNGYIKDVNGKIDLSQGDVLYSINNDNYKARRVDAWLK